MSDSNPSARLSQFKIAKKTMNKIFIQNHQLRSDCGVDPVRWCFYKYYE